MENPEEPLQTGPDPAFAVIWRVDQEISITQEISVTLSNKNKYLKITQIKMSILFNTSWGKKDLLS